MDWVVSPPWLIAEARKWLHTFMMHLAIPKVYSETLKMSFFMLVSNMKIPLTYYICEQDIMIHLRDALFLQIPFLVLFSYQ